MVYLATKKWTALLLSLLITIQYVHVHSEKPIHLRFYDRVETMYSWRDDPLMVCSGRTSSCQLERSEEDTTREKRIVFTALFVASIIVSLASLGFDIYLQIEGCCGLYPSACDYEQEFKNIRKNLTAYANLLDNKYTNSMNLLEHIKYTNTKNRDVWFHVKRIMVLQDYIFRYLDVELLNKLQKETSDLKQQVKDRNATVTKMNLVELTTEYNGVFSSVENALLGLGPIVGQLGGLAMGKALKTYKSYKITQALKANKVQLLNLNSKGRALLGVTNVNKHIATTASAQTKALSTASKASKFMKFAGGAMSVISIAMDIFMTIKKIQACKDVRDRMKKAVDKIRPETAKFVKSEMDLNKFHNGLEGQYATVKGEITNAEFTKYIAGIITLGESSHSPGYLKRAVQDVKTFQEQISKAGYVKTNSLQRLLVTALEKFTFTWGCYENQVKILMFVVNKCETGFGNMRSLYDQAVKHFAKIDDCTSATGDKYVTFAKTKQYVEPKMRAKNLEVDCLLNNPVLIELCCYYHVQGQSLNFIAGKTGFTTTQVSYVQKKCPPATVTPNKVTLICELKKNKIPLVAIKNHLNKYNQKEVEATYATC